MRTFLPLNTWTLQKAWGRPASPLGRDFWKAVAQSLVPPPESKKRAIWKEYSDLDSPALLSPSERRRFRNWCKRYLRRQLRNNPMQLAVRKHLGQLVQEMLDKEPKPDPLRIRKLKDLEKETNEYYSRLAEHPELPEEFGSVSLERAQDIVSLLWEFALYGEGGNKPKIRRTSGLWKALGIDPDEVMKMSAEDAVLMCLSRFEALFGLRGQPPEENNLMRLVRWVVKTHLPSGQEPETTPEALRKAQIARLIHRAIKVIDEESGKVVEVDVEDKGIAQPEAMLDLDDKERLCQFAELAGIDLNEFTLKEQERMLDLLDFFDKVGISFKEYYGGRADSEKTQRARLFQKIRKSTSHAWQKIDN